MHFKRLPKSHQATIDAVALYLIESLGADKPVKWYKLALTKLARMAKVHGTSLATVTMSTAEDVVVGMARVLTYVADPNVGRLMLDQVLAELHQQAVQFGVANPPPIDFTPTRPQAEGPSVRQPVFDSPGPTKPAPAQRTSDSPKQSSSNEQLLIPHPSSSLARAQEEKSLPSEEERRPIFSSARTHNCETLDGVRPTLRSMPLFSWPKKIRMHGEMLRGLIVLANEWEAAQQDPAKYVAELGRRLRTAHVKLTLEEAAAVQLAAAAIDECRGARIPPSILVTLAEVGALTELTVTVVRMLKLARLATAPVDLAEFERWAAGEGDISVGGVPALASLPVREKKPPRKPRDDGKKQDATKTPAGKPQGGKSPRICRDCGEEVEPGISWGEHRKVCPN